MEFECVTMTAQEWFDKAWERAGDPRKAIAPNSTNSHVICRYSTTDDGPGCFIGVCLPEELANYADFGASDAYETSAAELESAGLIRVSDREDTRLLSRLQSVHDIYCPSEWQAALRIIAGDHSLTIPDDR